MTQTRITELSTQLASSIAGKEPQDVLNLCRTFIELAVKEEGEAEGIESLGAIMYLFTNCPKTGEKQKLLRFEADHDKVIIVTRGESTSWKHFVITQEEPLQ
jgi:hypothetical protein